MWKILCTAPEGEENEVLEQVAGLVEKLMRDDDVEIKIVEGSRGAIIRLIT